MTERFNVFERTNAGGKFSLWADPWQSENASGFMAPTDLDDKMLDKNRWKDVKSVGVKNAARGVVAAEFKSNKILNAITDEHKFEFAQWLAGTPKTKHEEINTPWLNGVKRSRYNLNGPTRFDDCRQFVEEFMLRKARFTAFLIRLNMRGPQSLPEYYFYWKYIVKRSPTYDRVDVNTWYKDFMEREWEPKKPQKGKKEVSSGYLNIDQQPSMDGEVVGDGFVPSAEDKQRKIDKLETQYEEKLPPEERMNVSMEQMETAEEKEQTEQKEQVAEETEKQVTSGRGTIEEDDESEVVVTDLSQKSVIMAPTQVSEEDEQDVGEEFEEMKNLDEQKDDEESSSEQPQQGLMEKLVQEAEEEKQEEPKQPEVISTEKMTQPQLAFKIAKDIEAGTLTEHTKNKLQEKLDQNTSIKKGTDTVKIVNDFVNEITKFTNQGGLIVPPNDILNSMINQAEREVPSPQKK